jgi:hypothetical protein
MSLFYLYNPKQFIDPGWIAPPGGEEIRKRIVGAAQNPILTPETQGKVREFVQISAKLAEIQAQPTIDAQKAQILTEQRAKISQQILEMEDEENFLLLLLLD